LEPGDYEVRATLKDAGSERLIRVPFAAVP
jgi:hypothetical protein